MTVSPVKKIFDQTGEIPADALLGHIVLFTINDGEYRRDDVEKWFDELGLSPAFVPEPNKAVDAFKKATSEGDEFDYDLPDGTTAHVLVRDVASDSSAITRHLVRELKDSKRRRLAYGKIGEAMFYRPSVTNGKTVPGSERFRLTVDNDQLAKNERVAMQSLVAKITASYDRYREYMDGMKVRAMVRDYVKYLNSVALKPGVYFVHSSRREELEQLQQLVERLGHGCNMILVPLPDLGKMRDTVIEAFQVEAERSLAEVVQEILHIRGTRKSVTPDAYAKVKAKYDTVITRAKEYTRTLDVSQDRTAGAAEVALDALAALQQQMLGDDK